MKYRDFDLTRLVKSAGCAAKLDPADLNKNVANLLDNDSRVISSLKSNEDACVFALNSEISLVQTLDFITPIVDDPFIFGQIAAANALSDIFAMGGRVLNALNIVGFDDCNFSNEILAEILAGGKSKIAEAGGVLIGGHTIKTAENFYGLSVTGVVNGRNFWANFAAKPGDILILTKPLGSGIISTAIKSKMLKFEDFKDAIESMTSLNLKACEILKRYEIHACTDVTGFGLLGHLSEMLNENISFEIFTENFRFFKSVSKCLQMGLIPEGSYKNLSFVRNLCDKEPDITLTDAQTSGGLLCAVSENDAQKITQNLQNEGINAQIIGTATDKKEFEIYLK